MGTMSTNISPISVAQVSKGLRQVGSIIGTISEAKNVANLSIDKPSSYCVMEIDGRAVHTTITMTDNVCMFEYFVIVRITRSGMKMCVVMLMIHSNRCHLWFGMIPKSK